MSSSETLVLFVLLAGLLVLLFLKVNNDEDTSPPTNGFGEDDNMTMEPDDYTSPPPDDDYTSPPPIETTIKTLGDVKNWAESQGITLNPQCKSNTEYDFPMNDQIGAYCVGECDLDSEDNPLSGPGIVKTSSTEWAISTAGGEVVLMDTTTREQYCNMSKTVLNDNSPNVMELVEFGKWALDKGFEVDDGALYNLTNKATSFFRGTDPPEFPQDVLTLYCGSDRDSSVIAAAPGYFSTNTAWTILGGGGDVNNNTLKSSLCAT